VGHLASICNGLGLKLKTLSSTHTAARPPSHRRQQLQQCCRLPSSTLSQILFSCNGLSSLMRTSSHACCLVVRGSQRQDCNDAMRPNRLDRVLIFSLSIFTCALFYHCAQEQISRYLSLHDWMANERRAWLAARSQMFVGHLIAWSVAAYLLLPTVISPHIYCLMPSLSRMCTTKGPHPKRNTILS